MFSFRLRILFLFFVICHLSPVTCPLSIAQETLTITTYYPSPFGSYRELRSQRMAAGNNYINNSSVCWGGAGAGCPGGSADPGAATSMVVEGNVGIGTTIPRARLEVRAGAEGQAGPVEAIRIWGPNSPTNANSAQDLKWDFVAAGSAGIRTYRDTSWGTHLQFLTNAQTQGSDNPQIRMHISETGNVGIGTTTDPTSKLQVSGGNISIAGTTNSLTLYNDQLRLRGDADPWDGRFLRISNSRADTFDDNVGIRFALGAGDEQRAEIAADATGNLKLTGRNPWNQGSVAINYSGPPDSPTTIFKNTATTSSILATFTNHYIGLQFENNSNTINLTDAWRATPDAVTNTAEISNDTGAYRTLMIVGNRAAGLGRRVSVWDRLEVNGYLKVNGYLELSGSGSYTGSWGLASDIRWKKNIEDLSGDTLDKVLKLKGVRFEWRKEDFKDKNFPEGKQIGAIAQEIEKEFPELISEDADGYKSIAYDKFTVVLLEAIKTQQKEIEQLKENTDKLQKIISGLQNNYK